MFAKPHAFKNIYISNCKTSSFLGNEKEFKLPIDKTTILNYIESNTFHT